VGLLFNLEDGGNMFLQNVSGFSPYYMVFYPKIQNSKFTFSWIKQLLQGGRGDTYVITCTLTIIDMMQDVPSLPCFLPMINIFQNLWLFTCTQNIALVLAGTALKYFPLSIDGAVVSVALFSHFWWWYERVVKMTNCVHKSLSHESSPTTSHLQFP
jgi:hypothetical protein